MQMLLFSCIRFGDSSNLAGEDEDEGKGQAMVFMLWNSPACGAVSLISCNNSSEGKVKQVERNPTRPMFNRVQRLVKVVQNSNFGEENKASSQ